MRPEEKAELVTLAQGLDQRVRENAILLKATMDSIDRLFAAINHAASKRCKKKCPIHGPLSWRHPANRGPRRWPSTGRLRTCDGHQPRSQFCTERPSRLATGVGCHLQQPGEHQHARLFEEDNQSRRNGCWPARAPASRISSITRAVDQALQTSMQAATGTLKFAADHPAIQYPDPEYVSAMSAAARRFPT